MSKSYHVYILASDSHVLYIGITGNLVGRLYQHAQLPRSSYVTLHQITHLVHVEVFYDPKNAIAREKQLKGWKRAKKIELIESHNPGWNDLGKEWGIVQN